jgi:hypothetical protein
MNASDHGKWYWPPNYVGFSVACAGTWALIWILLVTLASTRTVHAMGYVFLGWVIGWITATLARLFYPAPRWTVLPMGRRGQS